MASIGKLLLGIGVDKKGTKEVKKAFSDLENLTDSLSFATKRLSRAITDDLIRSFSQLKDMSVLVARETFQVGTSFEQALKTVKAITGETTDSMRSLEDETRRLGATTAYTATESAQAMTTLARSGMKAAELLNVTSSALYFAGAATTSLDKSANLLASTIKQFSLDSTEAVRVTDTFTIALKESLFDMQSLTSAMRFGGAVGSSFNMSLEETVASLALFRNLGLEGSMAGTQFRMAMSKATKETNRGSVALKKYNLSYEDINPQMNTFIEIMQKVGKANMAMQDIISVFGVRSAGSIRKISEESLLMDNAFVKEFSIKIEPDTLYPFNIIMGFKSYSTKLG